MIRSLHLRNWFNHVKRDVTFQKGINVIVGQNGVGKSNLLDGIIYSLCGNTKIAGWATPAYPYVGMCQASLVFDVKSENDIATVNRYVKLKDNGLKDASVLVTFKNKSKKLTSIKAANEAIISWFGFDQQFSGVDDLLVCKQGTLTRLADMTAGERSSIISELIDITSAEVGRDALSDVTFTQMHYDVESLVNEIKQDEDSLTSIQDKLNNLPSTLQEEFDELSEKFTSFSYNNERCNLRKTFMQQVLTLTTETNDLISTFNATRDTLEAYKQEYTEKPDIDKKLKICTEYKVWLDKVVALQGMSDNLDSCINNKPEEPGEPPILPPRLRELSDNLHMIREMSSKTLTDVCPVCHSVPTDKFKDSVQQAKLDLLEFNRLNAEYLLARDEYHNKLKTYENYNTKVGQLSAVIEQCQKDVNQSRPADELPTESPSYLQCRFEQLAQVYYNIDSLTKELISLEVKIDNNKQRMKYLSEEIDRLPMEMIDISDLKEKVDELMSSLQERASLKDRLELYTKSIAIKKKNLEELKKKIKEQQIDVLYVESCNKVRKVLHKEQAPAMAIRSYLNDLGDNLSKWVASFGGNYTLTPFENWYCAQFPTHYVDLRKLSGAEKLIFGLSWHLSVRDTSLGTFPMVILDEPTYGMDSKRIDALCKSLTKWKELQPDHQMLVVTHDSRLADLADHVITLGDQI